MKNVVCIEHFKRWTFHSNELIKKKSSGFDYRPKNWKGENQKRRRQE